MKRARPKTILLVLLLAAVILGALATAAFYFYRAYEERKNYEQTGHYYIRYYLAEVMSFSWIWEGAVEGIDKSPIDLQSMFDDLRLSPPPNPYRGDHKTIVTTIDKRIPGAVWYIPGPIEEPYTSAHGFFLDKPFSGMDLFTKGDNPWLIGWYLAKPDGIKDGVVVGLAYDIGCYGDSPPMKNPSRAWQEDWIDKLHWHYADGSQVEPTDDRLIALFKDYYSRHPENFAAEKRPRMPKGFTISKEETEQSPRYETIRNHYKKLYGYDPVVGDEKAKK